MNSARTQYKFEIKCKNNGIRISEAIIILIVHYIKEEILRKRDIDAERKFNIMGTRFRNRLKRYNHASYIVYGLVNFRIMRSKGMMI